MIKVVNNDELSSILKTSFINESSIGIHGLSFESRNILIDLINSIYTKGLINKTNGGIVSNCEMIGTNDYYDNNRLLNYAYKNCDNYVVNLIINIPFILEGNNKKYFVGPFEDKHVFQKYDENPNSIWLNEYVNTTKILPKELIVGATIYNSETKETIYYENPNYLGKMDLEKQQAFAESIVSKCENNGTIVTIDENNIQETYNNILNLIDVYKRFSISSYYLEQAKKYVEEKYLNSKKY